MYLELSSNKKELLAASLESSVIRTLILDITCNKLCIYHSILLDTIENYCLKYRYETYLGRDTSSIIVVIPV